MDKKEYRAANWEATGKENIISGYAVVFDSRTVLYTDSDSGLEYGEVIKTGALDDCLMDDVILRFDHVGQVLARTRNKSLRLSIDNHGLKIEADLSGSQEGRSFYEQVKNGLIDKMSFAFVCSKDEYDPETRTRIITGIDRLFDVSLVSFPAYEQTEVFARSKMEKFAEPEHRAYCLAEVQTIKDNIVSKLDELGIDGTPEEYRTATGKDAEIERMKVNLALIREEIKSNVNDGDIQASRKEQQRFENAVNEFIAQKREWIRKRNELRAQVASGKVGTPIGYFNQSGGFIEDSNERKKENIMETAKNDFYKDMIERAKALHNGEVRTAANSTGMASFIPVAVLDQFVLEHTPGAFLESASKTSVQGAGTIRIPIAALQTVSAHTELAAITMNGYVPGKLDITHSEYNYNTGYSDKGVVESVASFENIISNTLLQSMMKKMDGICLDAVAGLTYTDGTNAVEVALASGAPTMAELLELAGYLGNDYLDKAKWYMNAKTYFSWILSLKDSDNAPIFDPSKRIDEQAPFGYGIMIDNQIPNNTIYFGDGSRVHHNFGRLPELVMWEDYDNNIHKMGVRAVAGAAVETGSFVKMYLASA